MKRAVIGTILTLIIGGTAYTVSQTDVINNFADDTGLTQEQAEQYINAIPEEDLASWDQIGSDLVTEGQGLFNLVNEIDCVNYEYEWESATLSCLEGKTQVNKVARDTSALGQAYIKLGSDSATKDDMSATIKLIDQLNSDYQLEIIGSVLSFSTIDDVKKTNSYNKALLKAALESE